MPTNSDFSRWEFQGDKSPHFEGTGSQQQGGQVPDTYQNVTLAGDSDPSASLSSSTWRGDDWKPENLPQSQADAVQASLDAHLDFNRAYGLNQGIATPGSHAWLRDSVGEYGDQEPDGEKGVPFSRQR